ncbi:MAG: hypothetical protein Q9210_002950 [Variospora velana]
MPFNGSIPFDLSEPFQPPVPPNVQVPTTKDIFTVDDSSGEFKPIPDPDSTVPPVLTEKEQIHLETLKEDSEYAPNAVMKGRFVRDAGGFGFTPDYTNGVPRKDSNSTPFANYGAVTNHHHLPGHRLFSTNFGFLPDGKRPPSSQLLDEHAQQLFHAAISSKRRLHPLAIETPLFPADAENAFHPSEEAVRLSQDPSPAGQDRFNKKMMEETKAWIVANLDTIDDAVRKSHERRHDGSN